MLPFLRTVVLLVGVWRTGVVCSGEGPATARGGCNSGAMRGLQGGCNSGTAGRGLQQRDYSGGGAATETRTLQQRECRCEGAATERQPQVLMLNSQI